MKLTGLIVGLVLMLLSFIVLVVCLMLPSMTHNRVNFGEALVGIVPSIVIGFIAFVVTVVSAVSLIKTKKSSNQKGGIAS